MIRIKDVAGSFAENKDVARLLRTQRIEPALGAGDEVVIDFSGVEGATQSFVHALLAETVRRYGPEVLDRLVFKGCSEPVRKIIGIVVAYLQE